MAENYCNIYIDEYGRIFKTEDEIILIANKDSTAIITVYVNSNIATDIIGYISFERADGFKVINRKLESVGQVNLEDDTTNTYETFRFLFSDTPRLLDIMGSLQVSFSFKGQTTTGKTKIVSTIATILLVKKQ